MILFLQHRLCYVHEEKHVTDVCLHFLSRKDKKVLDRNTIRENEKRERDNMFYWIVGCFILLCVAFVLYCCCWVAGRADAQSEAFFARNSVEK